VLVFVGGGSQFEASSNDLLGREVRLIGSSVYRPSEDDLLTRSVRERGLDLDDLVEEVFPPERASEAYARAEPIGLVA
jgi:threonine dehydrogenase-like Zn-dependent dehydrogenase